MSGQLQRMELVMPPSPGTTLGLQNAPGSLSSLNARHGWHGCCCGSRYRPWRQHFRQAVATDRTNSISMGFPPLLPPPPPPLLLPHTQTRQHTPPWKMSETAGKKEEEMAVGTIPQPPRPLMVHYNKGLLYFNLSNSFYSKYGIRKPVKLISLGAKGKTLQWL